LSEFTSKFDGDGVN